MPFTVPVPSPLKVWIPSTLLEKEKTLPSTGCKLAVNPAFGRLMPGVGFVGVAGLVDPGATRQAAVPVKAYSPLRRECPSLLSAIANAAHTSVTGETSQKNARRMVSPKVVVPYRYR